MKHGHIWPEGGSVGRDPYEGRWPDGDGGGACLLPVKDD